MKYLWRDILSNWLMLIYLLSAISNLLSLDIFIHFQHILLRPESYTNPWNYILWLVFSLLVSIIFHYFVLLDRLACALINQSATLKSVGRLSPYGNDRVINSVWPLSRVSTFFFMFQESLSELRTWTVCFYVLRSVLNIVVSWTVNRE